MGLQLKEAISSNIRLINEIMYHSFMHWNYDLERMKRFMSAFGITEAYLNENPVYMAYDDQDLFGIFSFGKCEDRPGDELNYFFINRELIGHGYGQKLWQLCCDKAKSKGIKEFFIWSQIDAANFYRKMGAKDIGTRPSRITPGLNPPLLHYSF